MTTPCCQAFDHMLNLVVSRFLSCETWSVADVAIGFKTVMRNLPHKRIRAIIIATDLDCRVHALVDHVCCSATAMGIPLVFALTKREMGSALGLRGNVSLVAIYDSLMSDVRAEVLAHVFALAVRARWEYARRLALAHPDLACVPTPIHSPALPCS